MKRFLASLLLLVLAAAPSYAGLRFRFENTTTGGPGSLAGTAAVEGSSLRIDVSRGDGFLLPDGAIVLSKDGGATLTVIDPSKQHYYQLELERMFASVGSLLTQMGGMFEMNVRDAKVTVTDQGKGEPILGYPTHKHRVRTSWTLDMNVMGQKTSFAYATDAEMWVTDAIPAEQATFLQFRNMRTGHPELDELIETQTAGVEGFPLKVVTRTRTVQGTKVDEQTTTMTVSEMEKVAIPAGRFEIPAGFERVASPLEALQQGLPR
ncbi:MAG: DUF4412 domain-containing protein [Thermoanaerobaculia bacterium]